MRFKLIMTLIGIFVLSSCSNQEKEQVQPIRSMDKINTDSLRQSKLFQFTDSLDHLFTKSPKELINIFGTPKEYRSEQVVNIHDGNIDTTYQLNFDSISVFLYYVSAQKRFLLECVEVKANSLIQILKFSLGSPEAKIINTLDLPFKSEIDSTGIKVLFYELGEIANSYTQFHLKDSKLIRVIYQPYLD